MATLGQRADEVYSKEDLNNYRRLVEFGNTFSFKSRADGNPDTIKGMIELRWKNVESAEFNIIGFEQFTSIEVSDNRGYRVSISQVNPKCSVLTFFVDPIRRIAFAMCPDTRWNRRLMADMYFEKRGAVIVKESTREGDILAPVLDKEIALLAHLRKAEREEKKGQNKSVDKTVDRLYKNLTKQQRDELVTKLVAGANADRAQISLSTVLPETKTTSAPTPAVTMDVGPAPYVATVEDLKQKTVLPYSDMKKLAKNIVVDDPANADVLAKIKKDNKKWHISKDFRDFYEPKVHELISKWQQEGVPAELVAA